MFEIPLVQYLLFPYALLYLLLHAGPLVRHRHEPSIRGGTDWRFFGSEVVLFSGYVFFAPAIMDNWVGRIALGVHLTLHLTFTLADFAAHDFFLGMATTSRAKSVPLWLAKEGGLAVDTSTHLVAVVLLGLAQPWYVTAAWLPLSMGWFWAWSNVYLRWYPQYA